MELLKRLYRFLVLVVNERMMGKYVHKYMTCGDCGGTTQKGYVEILEFTYFVEFFSFNKISENHREKELVRKVTVVVALDLGCGNTKNSEYESK